MDISLLRIHSKLVCAVLGTLVLTFVTAVSVGDPKPLEARDVYDMLGEGGIALIPLIWVFFILISRPSGRVTNLLVFGLLLLQVSSFLDFLDEFLVYSVEQVWIKRIESTPAPFGMILITVGLYLWHKEQLLLNHQLRRRERMIREPSMTDQITGLYSAQYMVEQIDRELVISKQSSRDFCLLMIDIDAFERINREYSISIGDRLLREVSELILMNIRTCDLACRYAGDRFIVLLPACYMLQVRQMAMQLENSIAHLAFRPGTDDEALYLNVSTSFCASGSFSSVDGLLSKLNCLMEHEKSTNREVAA